ncbi:unnamed protein product [Clonostachys rosea f. rosea IK726]|uniref:FAD-binding domain-containing protein n=2 Tax=Bionectria ochroleuca TaxID=29856 RepID=A0A0B7KJG5_BIOOC|nr:unnamed protein product [Clonostachys rosea f. rosea IK726]
MAAKTALRIIIVGAGPVGLALATGLAKDGHSVTVLERQSSLQVTGGPIYVQPPAIRVLESFGLGDAVQSIGVAGPSIIWSYKDTSEPLLVSPHRPNHTPLSTDRQTVQKVGYEGAVAAGATVLFGKTVTSLENETTPTVRTEDGGEYSADLIVGADGIKSKIRRLLFPDQNMDAIPTNEVIFHSDVALDELRADTRLTGMFEHPGSCHFTFGPGRVNVLLIEPVAEGKTAAYNVVSNYGAPPTDRNASWYNSAEPSELRELFNDFSARDRAYLEHVKSCNVWRIGTAPETPSWRSSNGRVLLIGDAAHAMVPHAAQGVSQGIESTGVLTHLLRLARPDHLDDVPALTEGFEKLRRPRVEKIANLSQNNLQVRVLPDGPAQEGRDAALRKMGQMPAIEWDKIEMDMSADSNSPQFTKWLTAYDIPLEVERFVKSDLVDIPSS